MSDRVKADISGRSRPARFARRGRMPADNVRRCLTATAMLVLLLACPRIARAQPEHLPDAAAAVESFRRVRGWVDAFTAPGMNDEASRVTIARATAVCVILRQSGRVVGMDVDATGDDLMLRRAAGRAMAQALADPAFAALRWPDQLAESEEDETQEADEQAAPRFSLDTAELGASLTLEIELAGTMLPLIGRSFDEMVQELEPGLHGLAIRHDEKRVLRFPAAMRATNTAANPARQLPGLALELGLTAASMADLLERGRAAVYSFSTIHLSQTTPEAAPQATFRGDLLVRSDEVTREMVVLMATDIAEHLARTHVKQVAPDLPISAAGGLMGDYRPSTGEHHPVIAPPIDQALAAFALLRFARTPGIDAAAGDAAAELGESILHELAARTHLEADPLHDAAACAAIAYAAGELPDAERDPGVRGLRAAAMKRLLQLDAGAEDDSISPHDRAIMAGALARALAQGSPGAPQASVVRAAIDAAWASAAPEQRAALAPWIAMAETDFARATGGALANVEALTLLRDGLQAAQLTPARAPDVADLHGSFAARGAGPTLADARSTRPAAFLAFLLRQQELSPPDRVMRDLASARRTMRFLRQLQVREECCWWTRNPTRAIGGVRSAPWDTEQPVAAQAMALLAASEFLDSLEALLQADGNRSNP